jgi:prolyl-tRNA editing enzyme YbaK/EbsC (Cys-tRNA(Pro) deacylase)
VSESIEREEAGRGLSGSDAEPAATGAGNNADRQGLAGGSARRFPRAAFLAQFFELHDVPHRFGSHAAEGTADHPTCSGVPLRVDGGWRMAVILSVGRLDLGKARVATGETTLRRPSPSEVRSIFPDLDAVSLPPIGPHYPAPELLDWRLLQHPEVSCHSGEPDHYVWLDPRAIVELAGPVVADICED